MILNVTLQENHKKHLITDSPLVQILQREGNHQTTGRPLDQPRTQEHCCVPDPPNTLLHREEKEYHKGKEELSGPTV
jgi:hypothetical protein